MIMEPVLEEVPCPLCGLHNTVVAARQKDLVHRIDSATVWTFRHCHQCNHYYLSPRPDVQTIGYFYPTTYSFHETHKLKVTMRSWLRTIVSQFYQPRYRPREFDYYLPERFLLRCLAACLIPVVSFNGLFGAVSTYLTRRTYDITLDPGMSFLEIGAGTGWDIHLTERDLSIRAPRQSRRPMYCHRTIRELRKGFKQGWD